MVWACPCVALETPYIYIYIYMKNHKNMKQQTQLTELVLPCVEISKRPVCCTHHNDIRTYKLAYSMVTLDLMVLLDLLIF